jgi:hypothetical protein
VSEPVRLSPIRSINRLINEGWTTRKLKDGTTEWIPPPHLDTGQPRTNTYFHPERMLSDGDGDDDDEEDGEDEATGCA